MLPIVSYPLPLLHSTIAGVAGRSTESNPEARVVCLTVVDMRVEAEEDLLDLRYTGRDPHSFGYLGKETQVST